MTQMQMSLLVTGGVWLLAAGVLVLHDRWKRRRQGRPTWTRAMRDGWQAGRAAGERAELNVDHARAVERQARHRLMANFHANLCRYPDVVDEKFGDDFTEWDAQYYTKDETDA